MCFVKCLLFCVVSHDTSINHGCNSSCLWYSLLPYRRLLKKWITSYIIRSDALHLAVEWMCAGRFPAEGGVDFPAS